MPVTSNVSDIIVDLDGNDLALDEVDPTEFGNISMVLAQNGTPLPDSLVKAAIQNGDVIGIEDALSALTHSELNRLSATGIKSVLDEYGGDINEVIDLAQRAEVFDSTIAYLDTLVFNDIIDFDFISQYLDYEAIAKDFDLGTTDREVVDKFVEEGDLHADTKQLLRYADQEAMLRELKTEGGIADIDNFIVLY